MSEALPGSSELSQAGSAPRPGAAAHSPFGTAVVVGLGLMGGSLALALRARGLARVVVGVSRAEATLQAARDRGVIDEGSLDLIESARRADLLVFCAPVGIIPDQMRAVAPVVGSQALVTDVGSAKQSITALGEALFGTRFVGSHPMAGSEQSGLTAARADLYEGAPWVIVRSAPFELNTDAPAQRIAEMAMALGSRPVTLDAATHDRIAALVSHLPHALSFAFAHTVAQDPCRAGARALAAGSYRDMMRVSASDPALWRDIFLDNREALLEAVTKFEENLRLMKAALAAGTPDDLLRWLQQGGDEEHNR